MRCKTIWRHDGLEMVLDTLMDSVNTVGKYGNGDLAVRKAHSGSGSRWFRITFSEERVHYAVCDDEVMIVACHASLSEVNAVFPHWPAAYLARKCLLMIRDKTAGVGAGHCKYCLLPAAAPHPRCVALNGPLPALQLSRLRRPGFTPAVQTLQSVWHKNRSRRAACAAANYRWCTQ
jgi:hypothetical protein